MKKLLALIIASITCLLSYADGKWDYKEGDVIFQISKSSQSKYIMYATSSVWTHCGIVIFKDDNAYVLEASNVVKLTPLDDFCNRGRFGAIAVYRYTDNPIKVKYKKYLNKPYDLQFSLTNKRYYCSELVWAIYKEQFGVELCKPHPISHYNTFGMKKLMKKRGISSKSLFIAPSDLVNSKKLRYVP